MQIKKLLLIVLLICSCSSGQKLLFSDQVTPESETYRILLPEQVTAGNESNFAPDISDDGKIVIYTSDRKGNKDIWQKASGGGFGYQLSKHSADDFSPVISPDGDAVAFVSRREDAAGDISVIDLGFSFGLPSKNKEKPVKTVSSNTTEDSSPAWFPSGDKIVFASRKPGDTSSVLMFAELSDRKAQPLSDIRGEQPNVSPDGKFVAYVRDGSIFVYNIEADKNEQLTESGVVQDGHPRFSDDGSMLVFVRYGDDTNGDGIFNADDNATAWKLDLAKHRSQKNKNNFEIEPLTAAGFSALYPQIRPPFLYVALSNEEGLDIFRYPQYGQVQLGGDKVKFEKLFAATKNIDEQIFLLRKMQHVAHRESSTKDTIEYAIREMEIHIQRGRMLELKWLSEKLVKNFPDETNVAVIAEVFQIQSELAPLMFPEFQGNLTPSRSKSIEAMFQKSSALSAKLSKDRLLNERAKAEILLLQAKIKASSRDFFDAGRIIDAVSKEYTNERRTVAKAQLYSGSLAPVVSGVDAAIVIYRNIISNYREQSDIVQIAVDRAVSLVTNTENPIEALQKLKTEATDLPILASAAHLQIAELFRSKRLGSVYANELRQIVEQYPDAQEVTISAAEALSKIEERNDRYDDAESMLMKVISLAEVKSSDFKKAAMRIYMNFLLRYAEKHMKDRKYDLAIELYSKVIKLEPLEINGHKGLIDAHFKLGTLGGLEKYYEDQYDDNSNIPEWAYFWSYLLTYKIDVAKGVRGKLSAIDDAIDIAEESRGINAQILQVHQTLGWLYLQKGYWLAKYTASGSVLADVRDRFGITRAFFGSPEPNWLELGIESFQAAYFLSKPDSIERAGIARNLAQTYFELKNFQKALSYYTQRIKLIPIIPIRDPEVEALVFRNAGRSAFQVEELELAESLQRNALLAWEKLDDKDMIKYSIDALALTLRERKNYTEALQFYERLRKLHASSKDKLNEVAALTNMGYCSYQLDRLEVALAQFNESSKILTDVENAPEVKEDESSDAYQLDLGGQGSSAKGFNTFDRKNLLVTFTAKIYEKWQRLDLVDDQYLAKLNLLKEERTFQIKKKGKSDKFLAEEISITANNLGELAVRTGRLDLATKYFLEAESFGKFLRPDDQKSMTSQESVNFINYAKIQLRKSGLGLLTVKDTKDLIVDIDQRVSELQKKFDEGDKTEAKYITQLISVSHQLRFATPQPGTNPVFTAEAVKNILATSEIQGSNNQKSRSVLLAFRDLPEGMDTDVLTPAKTAFDTFKEEGMKIPSLEWKFYAMDKQYLKSFESVDRFITGGGVLASQSDRLLLRQVFEKSVSEAAFKDDAAAQLFLRRFMLTKYLEMANRAFGKDKLIEGRNVRELPPRLKSLIEMKSSDDIKTALAGAGSITIHRMIDGKVLVSYQSTKSSIFKILALKNSTKLTIDNYQRLLDEAGVLSQLSSDGPVDLYIVPSGELYSVQWEQIATGKGKLNANYNVSFLPSVDFLPFLYQRKNVNKHWIGHVTSKENAVEFKNELGNRDYERFDQEKTADLVALRKSEILHVDAPFFLNSVEAFESYIDLNSDYSSQTTDISLDAFSRANQSGTSGIVFSLVVPSNDELKNSVEGHDGWASTFLASASAGIPSVILVPGVQSDKKNEDGDVVGTVWKAKPAQWAKFYKGLATQNYASALRQASIPGRLIGYAGVNESDAKDIAEENLNDILEEASESFEDQAFSEAAILLRKAYIYSSILGKDNTLDELLSRIYAAHHKNRRFQEAVYYIEKLIAMRSAAKSPDLDQLASDNIDAGVSSVHGQMFENAERHLKNAEDYYLAEEEWGYLGKIYEYRALNLANQVKYQLSIDSYLKSYEYYLKSNPENAALKLLSVANIYSRYLSQYDKALEYFDKAATQLKKLGKESYLSVIVDKANTLLTIGQIDAAIAALEREVLPAIDEEEQVSLWIRANQSLANIYFRGGKFPQAREITEKIIAQTQRIEDLRLRTERTNDAASIRAMVLAKTGNYAEAFEEFRKAIKLAIKYDLKSQVALLYNNYGFWAREYGATEQSIRFFEIAQRIDEELASKSSIAYDQRNIGLSSIVKGDFGRAEDLLSDALKTSEELNLAYNLAYCQFGLGDMEKTKGKFAEAKIFYEKALKVAQQSRLSDLVWRADAAIGFMGDQLGDKTLAEKHLRSSVQTIESLSPGLKTVYSSNDFLSDAGIYEIYDKLVDILMAKKEVEHAWAFSERARSRGIIDTIASQKLSFGNVGINDLMEKERSLKTELDTFAQLSGGAPNGEQAAKMEQYKSVLSELENKNDRILQFIAIKTEPLAKIENALKPSEALLQYHVTADKLHIWLITSGTIVGKTVNVKSSKLKSLVKEYREIMQNYSSTSFLEGKLSDLLIAPIASNISGIKRLIVVPHQSLHFVPFAALRLGERYLIDDMNVSYLESATQFQYVSKQRQLSKNSNISAFGFDDDGRLPFTTKEVQAIKRFFPTTNIFLSDKATEEQLKTSIKTASILHIASHGEFNTSDPTQSYLKLAGETGKLTVQEIFGLTNSADLVTLSACETGVGELSAGDEIISMHRAFFVAGANSVISNLWRINDVTSAVVMKRFYRALSEGKSKDEALRSAQVVAKSHFDHPAYWASYRLVGSYQ